MSLLTVLLLAVTSTSTYINGIGAEAPSKGDRGDPVTLDSVSSTGAKDLLREATGWERPTYGTQTWYPPQGNSKGWSRTSGTSSNVGYQGQQGYQSGYPRYVVNPGYPQGASQGTYPQGASQGTYPQGASQGTYKGGSGYVPPNRGGYQPGYGNNKGWSSAGSGWGGNYGRPWTSGGGGGGVYGGGNYKGGSSANQGWNRGGQPGYGDGWYGGNQVRPSSGGYNWPSPSTGYRGEKGYGGSYGGSNWGYGVNQGNAGGGSYGGGYGNQGLNKGLGNQIYGSGYGSAGGAYPAAGQKGWSNPGYGNAIPSQGLWGSGSSSTWDSYGYQGGNYKGGSSPRVNTMARDWSEPRSGYVNYPNNKGWW